MPIPTTLHWSVPSSASFDFYTLFYSLATALNLELLVGEGRRRGYPLRPWLVVLACTTLAFIMGTKLLVLSGPEWELLLSTGHWPPAGARTVLGGSAAVTLTLLALRRPFGLSWHVFDAFALPLCAALTVQCVGCLLTGCCFGEVTAGGWGLTYSPGTLPYLVQAYQGLIPAGAAHSLPVHPTQLYTLLLCAAVGAGLLLTRQRAWPAGSRHFLHLGLLLAGRFLIEFWREPGGEPLWNNEYSVAGLTMLGLQWVALPLLLLLLGAGLWLVRRPYSFGQQPDAGPTQHPGRNLLAVVALLALTAGLEGSALTRPEVLVVKAVLLAVLVLEGGALLGAAGAARPARVALPLGLACTVLVLTSQAPVDSARTRRESHTTLGLGISSGSFERTQNTEGGCGGASPLLPYRHRYTTGTVDLAYTKLPGSDAGQVHKAEGTLGVRLHAGGDQQILLPNSLSGAVPEKNTFLFAFNPYMRLDREWFGLGVGVLLGNLGYHKYYYGDASSLLDAQGSVRVGPRRTLFAIADYNYLGYGMGNPQQRLGLGTGFGGTRWQLLAGGATTKAYTVEQGQSYWSTFVEVQGQLTPQWQASSFLTLGNAHQQQAGLRLSHRFSKGK